MSNPAFCRPGLLFGLAIFVLCVHSAFAQQKPDPKTASYLWSAENQKKLYIMGLYLDKELLEKETTCENKYWLEPISFSILQPLEFAADSPHPHKGLWTFRYRFDRCDESIVYNALFQANPNGQPKIIPLVPGVTHASPLLARDMMPGVAIAVVKNNGGNQCKTPKIVNTKVTVEPHTLKTDKEQFDGAWEEEWTVVACSAPLRISFCLLPRKTGGTSWIQGKCKPDDVEKALFLGKR